MAFCLESECNKLISEYIRLTPIENDLIKYVSILQWRAGLSFLSTIDMKENNQHQFEVIHTRIHRNEETLEIETDMPISEEMLGCIR